MRIAILAVLILSLGCAKRPKNEPPDKSSATDDVEATAAPDARPQNVGPGEDEPPRPAAPLMWTSDEKAALARAKEERKPVLIDFAAEWCAPCKKYEREVFTDPAVVERLSGMVLLRVDVTEQNDADAALQQRYKAETLPTLIALSPDGAEKVRISRYLEAEAFLRELARLE